MPKAFQLNTQAFSKDDKPQVSLPLGGGKNQMQFKLDDIAKVIALTVAGVMEECGGVEKITAPLLHSLKDNIKKDLLTPEKMREKVSQFNQYLEMLAGGQ